MKKIKVRITFTEGLLGTAPNNEEIYRDYIASKAPDASTIEEEIEAVGLTAITEKGMTIFSRDVEGNPCLYDYQVKGFFKDSCSMLNRLTKKDAATGKKGAPVNESSKLKLYKKVIDGLIFVEPRMIPIQHEGEITVLQRPLRVMTMQGERVGLAISEEIGAGAKIEFSVSLFDDSHEAVLLEWLDYGKFRGIGQWRNSGKGRFVYDILDERGNVIGGNNEFKKATA